MAEKRPNRTLGRYHDTFWQYCNNGEFRLQRCSGCGKYLWPPSPVCDECLSEDLTWTLVSGKGKVFSYCTFERQFYPECPAPWHVILVQLEEGPWFISNPKDIPESEIASGLPVKTTFIDCEDEQGEFKLPVFEIDEETKVS